MQRLAERMMCWYRRRPHPLGPLVHCSPSPGPVSTRLVSLAVLAGALTPLVLAARLTPDSKGFGTHRQLGCPPCTMLVVTGYPCPMCGMTTAFAHSVRGQWVRAFHAQPMGWLLAVASMITVCASVVSVVTGRRWIINWYRIPPMKFAIGILLLSAAAWGYKILAMRSVGGGWAR